MTNTLISHYVVRPTEPDGDIVAYTFGDASAVWDYVTDTLAAEYGYATTDIDGIDIVGYCDDAACAGHGIGTVTAHYDAAGIPMTGPVSHVTEVFVVRDWLGYAVLVTDSAVDATIVARRRPGAIVAVAPAGSADAVEYRVAQYARRPFDY